jgi:hypothetical protein
MMVMELQSRFPPSEVMDALSIVYPQFWIEPGHEDKLTCHMNTLKAKFCVPKQISSIPLHNETSPPLLDAATLDRQLHWFKVAMVNNSEHAMRALDLNVHPIMKVWRNFAQSGPLRGCSPSSSSSQKLR